MKMEVPLASHIGKSVSETSYPFAGHSSESAGMTENHSSNHTANLEDWSDFLALGAETPSDFMEHVEDLLISNR